MQSEVAKSPDQVCPLLPGMEIPICYCPLIMAAISM